MELKDILRKLTDEALEEEAKEVEKRVPKKLDEMYKRLFDTARDGYNSLEFCDAFFEDRSIVGASRLARRLMVRCARHFVEQGFLVDIPKDDRPYPSIKIFW